MKKIQAILAMMLVAAGVFSFGSFVYAEETAAPASTDAATVAAPAEEAKEGTATVADETKTEETKAPETPTETPVTK